MPVRIYKLAQDLGLDSKELVGICTKAGVTGKGSALASLTDEEEAKLKAYMDKGAGGGGGAAPKPSAKGGAPTPPPLERPKEPAKPAGGKIRVIQSKPKSAGPSTSPPIDVRGGKKSDAPPPPVEQPTAEPPPVEEAPAAVVAEATTPEPASPPPAPAAPKKPTPKKLKTDDPNKTGFTRDDYIGPGGSGKKPPVLGKPKSGGSGESKGGGKQKSRTTNIKVANIPQASAPPPKPNQGGKAQKPVMRLPADAIKSAKAGGKAPLRDFTKKHDKSQNEKSGRGGGGGNTGGRGGRGAGGGMPNQPPIPPGEGKSTTRRRAVGKSDGTATPGEDKDGKKLAGMASARANRASNRRQNRRVRQDDDDDGRRRRRPTRLQRKGGTNTAAPRKGRVSVELPCTLRSLSEASGVGTASIMRELMGLGMMVTINQEIDVETAELVAAQLELDIDFKEAETLEDSLLTKFENFEDDPADLATRPPIITFLGHVDHGKTSLIDAILGINVADREAGGITQHIRAYKIAKDDGREIAVVDTPGHEAFTEMRARGANVTDIAVLVVAADDGVMPQTEEAINHARAAEVPIVVALNKIDLPGADENKAFQDLSTHGLLPTEWGGDVEVIKTSATVGTGLDDLLETLLLTAEIHEYKANPKRDATGVCLEARQDGDRGVVTTLIVTNGSLNVGDIVVCGDAFGKVKAMHDPLHPRNKLKSAGPSTPVSVMGLNIAPAAGERFYVMDDVSEAREIADTRKDRSRSQSLSGHTSHITFEQFQEQLEEGRLGATNESATLNMILRADVRGSIEAIQKEMSKLDHPEVNIRILQAAVGGITSADVSLADASDAVIVGFNVIPDEHARSLADERGVEIRRYDIIYKVTEDLRAMLEGKLKPEERVVDLGRALVQRLFNISRFGTIAGCRVLAGKIERGCRIRVNRDGRGVGDYPLDSLRREKDDTKEVREGFECGMKLSGFNDLKEGDILEAYKIEEVARKLEL